MKIKKLLSIGALAVVLASSLSIGASAATTTDGLSAKTKELIKVLAKNQYQNGKNQTDLFSNVNKNSYLKDISNKNVIDAINLKYQTTDSAVRIAEQKFINNEDLTFAQALDKVTNTDADFTRFKGYFTSAAGALGNAEKKTGNDRINAEKEFSTLVKLYNNKLEATFSKNGKGITTATLNEGDKIVVEVNQEEVEKAINEVNSFDYNRAVAEKNYLNSTTN